MIGIGKWGCKVDHTFFKGDASLEIKNVNGEYQFEATVENFGEMPEFTVSDVTENGNTLEGNIKVSLLPTKMKFRLEFDGDTMNGFLKIPFAGDVKFQNAKKIG